MCMILFPELVGIHNPRLLRKQQGDHTLLHSLVVNVSTARTVPDTWAWHRNHTSVILLCRSKVQRVTNDKTAVYTVSRYSWIFSSWAYVAGFTTSPTKWGGPPLISTNPSAAQSEKPSVPLSRTRIARRRRIYANVKKPVKDSAMNKLTKSTKSKKDT